MPQYSVYVLIKDAAPVYIGLSSGLSNRIRQHRVAGKDFDSHKVIYTTRDKKEALLVERTLIKFLLLFSDSVLNKQDRHTAYHRFFYLLNDEQRDAMQ